MRILLDCRPLQRAGLEGEKSRLIFSAAAAMSGRIEWVLMADRRYRPDLLPALPGRVVFRRAPAGGIGWMFRFNRQLRRVLRREQADMLWLTGGIGAGEMGVPVCLWMPERADPAEWGRPPRSGAPYRRRLKSSLMQAAAIVCYSDRDREWLERNVPEAKPRVHVLRPVAEQGAGPLSPEDKEKIRAKWTQGLEYFLADLTGCGEEEAVGLLKAFSLFKNRQQSRMRLVLAGDRKIRERISDRLATYRYRRDVDWAAETENAGAPPELAGAAYAVLLPAEGNGLGTTLLNMWSIGVPVIAANGGLWEEMGQGAVLGITSGDPASLAAQLMRIYKEEDLRVELTRKGFERLNVYSGENFLRLLRVITEIAAC
jgi:hypothetical protein